MKYGESELTKSKETKRNERKEIKEMDGTRLGDTNVCRTSARTL